jgi:ABC-type Co2+ transport system permease subunit
MKKHFPCFLVSAIVAFICISALTTSGDVTTVQTLSSQIDPPADWTNMTEVIKYVVSILAGIISAVLMAFLKRKFPKIFGALESSKK